MGFQRSESFIGSKGWRFGWSRLAAALLPLLALGAWAQYPGRVEKAGKAAPTLRSIAVLEWTGAAGKPSASRLVPVAVFDGEQLNDGTIYMNRPEPLALDGGVEYELQSAGKPTGLFDVFAAGELDGAWRGFGIWRPLSKVAAASAGQAFNSSSLVAPVGLEDDDKPVLKRKHPKGTDGDSGRDSSGDPSGASAGKGAPASASGDSAAKAPEAAADPDRPTLKRKDSGDAPSKGSDSPAATSPAPTSSVATADSDPDRPTIRRSRKNDAGMMETSTVDPDPDRPRLKRGKPAELGSLEPPKLEGLPPTMQQAVAVSDTRSRVDHPWKFSWADPADELRLKAQFEAIARTALGMDAPAAPAKAAHRPVAGRKPAKASMEPAEPVALEDEKFQCFELAFGSSATLVLTASSPKPEGNSPADTTAAAAADAPPVIRYGKPVPPKKAAPAATAPASATPVKAGPQRFVTLIGQPDLYGGVIVLYKSVTDSAHQDVTPRMRLVDAVDAMGDNRGELLFELRGAGQRQFALYRVLRGSAEQLFATVAIP